MWSGLGVGARLAAAGILATALASSGVARADDEDDAEATEEVAPPEAATPAPSPNEDIEAEVDEAPAPATSQCSPAPSEQPDDTVLIPSKHAARYGRRPLRPLPSPATYRPAMVRQSTGLMAAGIVFTSLGTISAIVGGALLASAHREDHYTFFSSHSSYDNPTNDNFASSYRSDWVSNDQEADRLRRAGTASLLVGLTAVALGIPFIAVGAKKVPARTIEGSIGPTGGTLLVHF